MNNISNSTTINSTTSNSTTNNSNINNTLLIKEYTKALIENVDKTHLPKELNLIFDGGVFNSGFASGVSIYIKTLEEAGLIKINKISGCSAGSLIALWYITGCKDIGIKYFENMMQSFKENLNFNELKNSISVFLDELFFIDNKKDKNKDKNIDISMLNNKFFINYYDTSKNKNIVVSNFDDKDHLIKCILRTCHIPYINDGNSRCDEHYMDGIVPHIFNDGESLFIKLFTFNKLSRTFILKSEANIHYRLLSGVSDANDFFTTGKSDMCCYISKRGYKDIILLRSREIVAYTFFCILDSVFLLKNSLSPIITESLMYNGFINTSKSLLKDMLRRIVT
jgi:hypothetical protein